MQRNLISYGVLLVLLMHVAGCKVLGSSLRGSGVRQDVSLPTWYTQPPADTTAFYAVGEGLSFKEAEKAARASLAEQIQVQVSSYVKTFQVRDGNYQRDYFRVDTQTAATGIALTGAAVVAKEIAGLNCYSMIKLDKSALMLQQSTVIEVDKSSVIHALNKPDLASFERWWYLKRLAPTAERLQNNVVLMAVVAGQEDMIAHQLVQNFHFALRETEGFRKLRLINHTRIEGMDSLVREQLSDQGVELEDHGGADTATLVMATHFKQQVIGSDVYIDGEMSIELVSAGGAVLNQRRMNKTAVVIGEQELGVRQINRQLYQAMKKDNVLEQLLNET